MNLKETQKAWLIPTLTDTYWAENQCVHIPNLQDCYSLISSIDSQTFTDYAMQAKNLKMYCYNFSMASFVNIKIHIYYCLVSWFFSPLSTFSLLWSLTNNTGSQSIPPVLLCSGIVRHVKEAKLTQCLLKGPCAKCSLGHLSHLIFPIIRPNFPTA